MNSSRITFNVKILTPKIEPFSPRRNSMRPTRQNRPGWSWLAFWWLMMFVGCPLVSQAQDEAPWSRNVGGVPDFGPGRQRESRSNRQDEWNPEQRVARRMDDPRSGPSRSGANEPWWEQEPEANADFARGEDRPGSTPHGSLIRSSQIVAMVGNEPILAGDILGQVKRNAAAIRRPSSGC